MAKKIDMGAPMNRLALLAIALGLIGGIATMSGPSKAHPHAVVTAAEANDLCTIAAQISGGTQSTQASMRAALGCPQARP